MTAPHADTAPFPAREPRALPATPHAHMAGDGTAPRPRQPRAARDIAPPDDAKRRRYGSLAVFGALTAAAAVWGATANPDIRSTRRWYDDLDKPDYTPPKAVFGPVWTGLYALIATSGWRVWRQREADARTPALGLWAAQLGLNAWWSRLFFGRRDLKASFAESLALAGSVGAYTAAAARVDRPAATMVLPYLGWVTFAAVLTGDIMRRNG